MKNSTFSKARHCLVLMAMLAVAQVADATPFKNFSLTLDAYPKTAGTVYMSCDDPDPKVAVQPDEWCDLKFTTGEGKVKVNGEEVPVYRAWLQAKPAEGYKFVGFVEKKNFKEDYDYNPEDFVQQAPPPQSGSSVNPNPLDGFVSMDVDVNEGVTRGEDANSSNFKDDESGSAADKAYQKARNEGYWPETPDHEYLAIFSKSFSSVQYAYVNDAGSVNHQSATFGTYKLAPYNHEKGDPITLTATPKPGFKFLRWQTVAGEVLSTDAVWNTTATDTVYVPLFALADIEIPSTGWTSYTSPAKVNFERSAEELRPYIVDSVNVSTKYLGLKPVNQISGSTPIVISAEIPGTYDLDYMEVYWSLDAQGNKLSDAGADGLLSEEGSLFVFKNGDKGAGFYRVGEGEFTDANAVCFTAPSDTDDPSVDFLPMSGAVITGIGSHRVEKSQSDATYNLNGQSVSKSYKGVVVRKGSKFINK